MRRRATAAGSRRRRPGAPPLSCSARSTSEQAAVQVEGPSWASRSISPSFQSRSRRSAGPALDQPVGVEQHRPAGLSAISGAQLASGRCPAASPTGGGTGVRRGPRARAAAGVRPAGPALSLAGPGASRPCSGGEQLPLVPLADQHLLQLGQQLRLVTPASTSARHDTRSSGAERRLVRAVPAHVADDRVHPCRRPSTASKKSRRELAGAAGRKNEPCPYRAARQQRRRQQAALQPGPIRRRSCSSPAAGCLGAPAARPRSGWPG